jgi:hypothetical protein
MATKPSPSAEEAPKKKKKESFHDRLGKYGKWRAKTDMNRFVTLVFLTAEEKAEFCQRMFKSEYVDYVEGKFWRLVPVDENGKDLV